MVRDADNPSSIYSCVRAARARVMPDEVLGKPTTPPGWNCRSTCTPACWNAIRAVLRMDEVPLAPGAWRHHRHHAGRRSAVFHAHRHAPGTRRQRAHAGREVPRTRRQRPRRRGARRRRAAATAAQSGSTAGRRCSARCRAWRSTAGLPRRDHARPRGRAAVLRPDMPRSLLAAIHSLSDDLARVANQRSARSAAPACCARNCNTGASRTSWPAGCTVPGALPGPHQRSRQPHQPGALVGVGAQHETDHHPRDPLPLHRAGDLQHPDAALAARREHQRVLRWHIEAPGALERKWTPTVSPIP